MIHPTAVVDKNAQIDETVEIGPYSIIRENVSIGKDTVIGPHVVIDPHVTIGAGCRIFQFASVGGIPQDLKFEGEKTVVEIGDNTVVAARAGVTKSIPSDIYVSGFPAKKHADERKIKVALLKLPDTIKLLPKIQEAIQRITRRIEKIELSQ